MHIRATRQFEAKFALLLAAAGLATFPAQAVDLVILSPLSIVQNGGFIETATTGPTLAAPWTAVGVLYGSAYGVDGTPCTQIGSVPISQTLNTIPGQQYQISFYAAPDLTFYLSASFKVSWGDQTVATFSTPTYTYDNTKILFPQIDAAYNLYSVNVTAVGASENLQFVNLNGTQAFLDAVQVIPVPEPSMTAQFVTCLVLMLLLKIGRTSGRLNLGVLQ